MTDLIDDTRRAAALITPDRIPDDHVYDVIDGSAGAILGLLRLHQTTGDGNVLERAVICGEPLLANQRVTPGNTRPGKFGTAKRWVALPTARRELAWRG